jgi:hypothetical protein
MGILECFGGIPVKSKRLNPNSRNAEERSNSKRLRGKARTTAGLTMNPELTDTMLALPRRCATYGLACLYASGIWAF